MSRSRAASSSAESEAATAVDPFVADRQQRLALLQGGSDLGRGVLNRSLDRRRKHGEARVHRPVQARVACERREERKGGDFQEEESHQDADKAAVEEHSGGSGYAAFRHFRRGGLQERESTCTSVVQ